MFNFLKGRLLLVRLIILGCMAALIVIGVVVIYASGNPNVENSASQMRNSGLWKKQCVFAAAGFAGFVLINSFNYRKLGAISPWLYIIIIGLLGVLLVDKYIINLPFVPVKHGSRRWLVFGSLPQFQPSEFFKIIYITALAWHLRFRSNYRNFSALIAPFLLTLLPMVLILLEPDLGTVMLMMPVLFAMLFIAGAKLKHLLLIVLLAILASPLLWLQMHDYQRMRISSLLIQNNIDGSSTWFRKQVEKHEPLAKTLGLSKNQLRNWEIDEGYQLTRSKLAIASGGASGQGYRTGPFIKYHFLPDRHNDFIFAIIGHQWGFAGCVGLMGLYALLIACGMEIASGNTDPFGRYIAAGILAMFTIQILANISMTIGLMPITGITLPFISYGGSSLVVNIMLVGLLSNVGRSRPFSLAVDRD
ncbi:MAG: rod shape-determining protein RodA [Anaerohalosphaeraceae bacterium]|nr:rod shape-determining protein RodA [Anaerohalosphaeraceae bacterium]